MASGTINLGTSGNITGRITWSSTTNIAANNSTVNATIQVKRTNNYTTTGTWSGNLTIGGESKNFTFYSAVSDSWVSLYSFSITKTHSADGKGSCYISGWINGPSGTSQASSRVSSSATVTLDLIPRAATLTSAPNFNDEANPTISYSNPAGSAVDALEACITLDEVNAIVAFRSLNKTGSSYTFNITAAERTALRKAASTTNSISVKFLLRTTIGSNTYFSILTKTLTIINAAPTLAPTAIDKGSVSTVLTGDANNKIIKGYNSMAVVANATARKEATIKSYKISCGGKSITTASGTLSGVESGDIVFTATDSRGNTATQTIKKTLINYVDLSCNINIKPPTTSGDLELTVSGNYFNGSFGAKSNSLTVEYRYKTNDEAFTSWIALTPDISSNTYSASVSMSGLDYLSNYTFQARAKDEIYNGNTEPLVQTPEKRVKTLPVFDWGENDFAFHTPVIMDNSKQLYFKNTDGGDVMMISLNNSNQSFFGYGGYNQYLGSTYFDGNQVNIRSRENISNTAGGTIGGNKAWTNSSDMRLKEDIVDLPEVFSAIWQELQPKMFRWNELNNGDNTLHFGLIAQDVIEVFSKYGLDWRNYGFVATIPVDGVDYFAITYEYYNILTAKVLKNTIEELHDIKRELASIKAALASQEGK